MLMVLFSFLPGRVSSPRILVRRGRRQITSLGNQDLLRVPAMAVPLQLYLECELQVTAPVL